MKVVTLPLVSGEDLTLYIGSHHLAVLQSKKEPNQCRIVDGNHNNGGWPIALTAKEAVKRINAAVL